jgi:Tol biopolymer transport system component
MEITERISRRRWLKLTAMAGGATLAGCRSARPKCDGGEARPQGLIGYTELRTNLPGGRFANAITARAWAAEADGSMRRPVGAELAREPYSWTQFAGWSPDGHFAIVGRGWESPENGAWEEEHRTFRFNETWLYDMYLVDIRTGAARNVTSVERVSHYNTGLFFMPGRPPRLGFQALIDGNSHPFSMDLDGRNKKDLTTGGEGFTYGFSASPDGQFVSYHKDYQVYVGPADGTEAHRIETGHPFNFAPQWSPDGQWLLFVSGERLHCDPYVVRPDGSGLRRVASRNGYQGWVAVFDVYDFHDGSSDVPVWAADSRGIYYTAMFEDRVELMWAGVEGETRRLTKSAAGVLHYHPKVSPDGRWLVFGSTRDGARRLYVRPSDPVAASNPPFCLTDAAPGSAAMWAAWQPDSATIRTA